MEKVYKVKGERVHVVVYRSSDVCKRGYYMRRWDTFGSSELEFIGNNYDEAVSCANKTVAADEKWQSDFNDALGINAGYGLVTVETHMLGSIEFEEFSSRFFISMAFYK